MPDYDPSAFPPFAVTADIALFTVRSGKLQILLVERGCDPYIGSWALPGGFIQPNESAEQAAVRELAEEAAIHSDVYLEQLATFSAPERDPRMRVVTIVYTSLVPDLPDPCSGTDAADTRWFPVTAVPPLAFDHDQILATAVDRVRAKLEYTTVATAFLPRTFTIGELRAVYEAVWGVDVPLQNFRRKVLATPGFIVATDDIRMGVPGPKAKLYTAGDATEIVPAFNRARMTEATP